MRMNKVNAPCTILLAAMNVIVFIVLTSRGMTEDGAFLLEHGAMYVLNVTEQGEYYRLIGKVKYLIIYLISGLGGNLLSAWWEIQTADYAISAGASGAVFGLIGTLLYVAIRNHGRVGEISGRGIVFMIIVSLYYGFTSSGVDNMAHIGGLVTGFLLGVLLYWKYNRKDGTFAQS